MKWQRITPLSGAIQGLRITANHLNRLPLNWGFQKKPKTGFLAQGWRHFQPQVAAPVVTSGNIFPLGKLLKGRFDDPERPF